MIAFKVKDMTCSHCVGKITKALQSANSQAKFTIDQARHLIMIESTDADPKAFRDAVADAGYTPVPVEEGIVEASAQSKICCGHKQ